MLVEGHVEIKGDEEAGDPAPDNVKKYEYAAEHYRQLNEWLAQSKLPTRYQFDMLSPKGYNAFFQKLRDGKLVGFRSELDVAMNHAITSNK